MDQPFRLTPYEPPPVAESPPVVKFRAVESAPREQQVMGFITEAPPGQLMLPFEWGFRAQRG